MDDWLDPLRGIKREAQVNLDRVIQAVRFGTLTGEGLPRIYGNAIPKCGSHLMYQFFEGLTKLCPVVIRHRYPIRPYTPKGRRRTEEEILDDLASIGPGEIGWGYLFGEERLIRALDERGAIGFQLIRDPRDKIVSQILYAMEIHEGHRMRGYYKNELENMEERISATIEGVEDPGNPLADIHTVYERYQAWMEHPSFMLLRFEDLMQSREGTLEAMLGHLEAGGLRLNVSHTQAISSLNHDMSPTRSATFRSGKSGSWEDYFSEENKRLFKEIAGQLLIDLGYERSNDW
jgi:hypothetical protein